MKTLGNSEELRTLFDSMNKAKASFSYLLMDNVSFIEQTDVEESIKYRDPFAHKGHFGHALLFSGSYCRAGASVLAARAVLRSGAGLVSVSTAAENVQILQTAVPEAMIETDKIKDIIFEHYSAIGVGPAWGISESKAQDLSELMKKASLLRKPMVLDADAITILSLYKELRSSIPQGCILTPHQGELKRLLGEWKTEEEKIEKQKEFSYDYKAIVVSKGAYTTITYPNKEKERGLITINPTGNVGMATAGSGDVLTGIITGLLSQGYNVDKAAWIGTYIHGLSGDMAAEEKGQISMIAGDIVNFLPKAFKSLDKIKMYNKNKR